MVRNLEQAIILPYVGFSRSPASPCFYSFVLYNISAYMVSHRGHNCISSALTILDSALTS